MIAILLALLPLFICQVLCVSMNAVHLGSCCFGLSKLGNLWAREEVA
jgi:hypothetical protein